MVVQTHESAATPKVRTYLKHGSCEWKCNTSFNYCYKALELEKNHTSTCSKL